MVFWIVLPWIMSGIALAGTIINAERNKYGFVLWMISNLYMTIDFLTIGRYAQAILFFIYFVLAIRGILVWNRKEENDMAVTYSEEEGREAIKKLKKLEEYLKSHENHQNNHKS